MKYILLLRGINVGGRNKVKMEELKLRLYETGFTNVVSYINSGNLIFDSACGAEKVKQKVAKMLLECYDFEILFALVTSEDYIRTSNHLPDWWQDSSLARRDVLFFTDEVDLEHMVNCLQKMTLFNEIVHFTDIAVFWGKIDEKLYSKTAYHKYLGTQTFYKQITIRNGNTFDKIRSIAEGR